MSSAGLKKRYNAIVRSSETSAQKAHVRVFMSPKVHAKVYVFKLPWFFFRGSYFWVLVVGHENRENLDFAKISRYTINLLL